MLAYNTPKRLMFSISRISICSVALVAMLTQSVLYGADPIHLEDADSEEKLVLTTEGKKGLNAVNVKVVSVGPSDVITEMLMDLLPVLDWYFPVSESAAVRDVLRGLIDQPEEPTEKRR